jgi:hypothetical protein
MYHIRHIKCSIILCINLGKYVEDKDVGRSLKGTVSRELELFRLKIARN